VLVARCSLLTARSSLTLSVLSPTGKNRKRKWHRTHQASGEGGGEKEKGSPVKGGEWQPAGERQITLTAAMSE